MQQFSELLLAAGLDGSNTLIFIPSGMKMQLTSLRDASEIRGTLPQSLRFAGPLFSGVFS
jgi:hypothetical protein